MQAWVRISWPCGFLPTQVFGMPPVAQPVSATARVRAIATFCNVILHFSGAALPRAVGEVDDRRRAPGDGEADEMAAETGEGLRRRAILPCVAEGFQGVEAAISAAIVEVVHEEMYRLESVHSADGTSEGKVCGIVNRRATQLACPSFADRMRAPGGMGDVLDEVGLGLKRGEGHQFVRLGRDVAQAREPRIPLEEAESGKEVVADAAEGVVELGRG